MSRGNCVYVWSDGISKKKGANSYCKGVYHTRLDIWAARLNKIDHLLYKVTLTDDGSREFTDNLPYRQHFEAIAGGDEIDDACDESVREYRDLPGLSMDIRIALFNLFPRNEEMREFRHEHPRGPFHMVLLRNNARVFVSHPCYHTNGHTSQTGSTSCT